MWLKCPEFYAIRCWQHERVSISCAHSDANPAVWSSCAEAPTNIASLSKVGDQCRSELKNGTHDRKAVNPKRILKTPQLKVCNLFCCEIYLFIKKYTNMRNRIVISSSNEDFLVLEFRWVDRRSLLFAASIRFLQRSKWRSACLYTTRTYLAKNNYKMSHNIQNVHLYLLLSVVDMFAFLEPITWFGSLVQVVVSWSGGRRQNVTKEIPCFLWKCSCCKREWQQIETCVT